MKKMILVGLAILFFVGGCGSSSSSKYSAKELHDAEVGSKWYKAAKEVDASRK